MTTHHDVLIIGAGLSGICAGHYIKQHTKKSFAILEARENLGGTWDLFRYPGIRSDSDMHTLGFSFRPWPDPEAIADGPAILTYLQDTVREEGLEDHIAYDRKVVRGSWSTNEARWTVTVQDSGGNTHEYTCDFLWACTGYYRYDTAHMPDFPGADDFEGTLIHPQFWDQDLDYRDKNVVVIGSGATAVTLVPAMASDAAHVTMLQRSPSYVMSVEGEDAWSNRFTRVLGTGAGSFVTRWKNILRMMLFYQASRKFPGFARKFIVNPVRDAIGEYVDVDTHFNPTYDPWDQRVCFVPDEDLFEALRNGSASVVTDHIESFTKDGIRLRSGDHLDADIVVSATGLELVLCGGAEILVDGEVVQAGHETLYKGAMMSNLPNAVISVGYTNASWTLKCELISKWVVRLLAHMDAHGHEICVPRLPEGANVDEPIIDFNSGYVVRALKDLPNQGEKLPWRLYQNYILDSYLFRFAPVGDDALEFS